MTQPNIRFSRRTLTALAQVISSTRSHTEIDALAYELSREADAVGPNKLSRSISLVQAIEGTCCSDRNDGQLAELIQHVLGDLTEWQRDNSPDVAGLVASLQTDGFAVVDGSLVPTTPPPTSLGREVSILETELESYGFGVAVRHYSQACDNLAEGNFESANGQVRSFLENFFICLCTRMTNKVMTDAKAALQHLYHKKHLDSGEWNTFRGFWDSCQTNGPHHGLSSEREALYRLQLCTAIARYIVSKMK